MAHHPHITYCLAALLFLSGANLSSVTLSAEPGKNPTVSNPRSAISFNRDIRPIFSETCFHCHGPDPASRKADLRFDVLESALAERDGGDRAIVPGDPEASKAWVLINETDPDNMMPPKSSNMVLSDTQKAKIKRWIEEGAHFEKHWAFIAPIKKSPPQAHDKGWSRNEIDRFVEDRLERESLETNPEADRRTLIRRLSFDLMGLPPSREEIDAFLKDQGKNAYERLVDRILASPHYGERMALSWLDQARYADTNGYSRDGGRTMWLWRDWVIQAYNDDKPFSEFLREQLAGDLIPNATQDQIVATGFSRNHMITAEGGTIPLENLTNYTVDRVKTTGEAFLGLTLACAQCHEHKFDPISQRDYYQLFAYFNTLDDKGTDGAGGNNAKPTVKAKTSIKHQNLGGVKRRIASLSNQLITQQQQMQHSWEAKSRETISRLGKDFELHGLTPAKINAPDAFIDDFIEVQEDGSVYSYRNLGSFYSMVFKLPARIRKPVTGIRIEFYPHPKVREGSLGYGKESGGFGISAVTVSTGNVPVANINTSTIVSLRDATASYSHPNHPPTGVLNPNRFNAWSPLGKTKETQHLTVMFDEAVDRAESAYLTVMNVYKQIGSPGHFKVYAVTGENDESNIPGDVQTILRTSVEKRSEEAQKRLADYHREYDPRLSRLRADIAANENRLKEMTLEYSTQVMDTAKTPRRTYILSRGSYDKPGEEVQPGVPAFLPPLPENAPNNRLGLAEWFLRDDHPLTARVAVNRMWQMIFGIGLVSTSADFGSQGDWPSHPDLLDWLAVDFREHGWHVKRLLKQIVMSSTYRQDSAATERKMTLDPDNRFLSRGPRSRLQAEFIRDAVLKQSGLLNDWIGGSSVKPYQPAHIWRELSHYGSVHDTTQVFVQDHASNLYRRSMYTLWKRTNPPPGMMTFDAPSREICIMHRESTNTPLQALALLNDVQYVEASRQLAQSLLTERPHASDRERIGAAFELMTSRRPDANELEVLVAALNEQLDRYTQNPKAALDLLGTGESPRNTRLEPAEHAAYTIIVNLIINLSESITKS